MKWSLFPLFLAVSHAFVSSYTHETSLQSLVPSASPFAVQPNALTATAAPEASPQPNSLAKVVSFINKHYFLCGMVVTIGSANVWPALGKTGGLLRPEVLIHRFGVTSIFLFSGLSLELSQLTTAIGNVRLNAAIQAAIFGLWPLCLGLPLSQLPFLPPSLRSGLLILSCLPTTVNMNVLLTSSAGGNVATALCNAVLSNMAGIFVTPALLLHFFGSTIDLPLLGMLRKLSRKVLLPVLVGQVLRKTRMKDVYEKNTKTFRRVQETILLTILWNAFCNAFSTSLGLTALQGVVLAATVIVTHTFSFAALWALFGRLPRDERVAATYCASQKTLAFGLPLIQTVFEGSPHLASYCAPLMFIHPLQLLIGSSVLPRVQKYIQEEKKEE